MNKDTKKSDKEKKKSELKRGLTRSEGAVQVLILKYLKGLKRKF